MKKFVIVTDSSSDLSVDYREKYDIDYIPMHMSCEGKEYVADLDWKELSFKDFYDMIRGGKRFMTAQITVLEYKERFTQYAKEGYDVLSISCSSALSASFKASQIAGEEIMKEYPETKIVCVDSLRSCMGLGELCIKASQLREEGKTVEEVKTWLEENRLTARQECTVDTLKYFRQAGRVSAASAFFGGLLAIKPMVVADAIGQNFAVEKIKGKKTAINRMVERCLEDIIPENNKVVYVGHADAIEDANVIKEMLENKLPKDIEIIVGKIGPIIGATAGPGTLSIHYFGTEVTYNAK